MCASSQQRQRELLSAVVVVLLTVTLFSGVAAAQTGLGGTTTVGSDETVSSVSGVYGTIIIEGTVTGDVSGLAGNVVIEEGATVEGDLSVAAGNIRVAGEVHGEVSAGAGTVTLAETARVGGTFSAGAADVRIDGRIDGDARVGADRIHLGDDASIAGSLTYDGTLEGNREAVAGEITRDRSLSVGLLSDVQPFLSWVVTVSVFVLNLALGALLLTVFPRFSERLAGQVSSESIESGAIGLAVAGAVPAVLILIAVTVIGIPLALGGLLLFALLAWVGLVYGRFAIGVWLLSYTEVDSRWAALVVGLVLAAVLSHLPVPFVGGVLNLLIFLLGIGALVRGLYSRGRRQREKTRPPDEVPTR